MVVKTTVSVHIGSLKLISCIKPDIQKKLSHVGIFCLLTLKHYIRNQVFFREHQRKVLADVETLGKETKDFHENEFMNKTCDIS